MTGGASAPPGAEARERGSAVAEFVMVAAVVCVLFLGLIQLAVFLHQRNELNDAASLAARRGAQADGTTAVAIQRARDLLGNPEANAEASLAPAPGGSLVTVTLSDEFSFLGLMSVPISLHASATAFKPEGS